MSTEGKEELEHSAPLLIVKEEEEESATKLEEEKTELEFLKDETKPIQGCKWTMESMSTLPKFSSVRQGHRSVEDWCNTAWKVMREYEGPTNLMVKSLEQAADLPEFKRDSYESRTFTVKSMLQFIATTWNDNYAQAAIQIVLVKKPTENWTELYILLSPIYYL